MKQAEQIPRNALFWIVGCQALLVAPHALRLPIWVLLLYAAAFVWRLQMARGRWPMPPRTLKLALILAVSVGIAQAYGSMVGLEPTVALLLAAFALKLIESVRRHDAYVLIFLGFFICVTEFLFTQDLAVTLYMGIVVWLLVTALLAVHREGATRFEWQPLQLSALMLLQAVPLMLVLFFLFPRLGPLWSVPLKNHTATTGMSDTLRVGDVSNLVQSSEVAFRVLFEAEVPPMRELYWRGLVMSVLEDDRWRGLRYFEIPPARRRAPSPDQLGRPLDYRVLMAPTQQNWLYALRHAEPQQRGIMALPDFRLYSPMPVESELSYRVRSWPEAPLQPQLNDWRRDVETRLPMDSSPRTRALATQLRAASVSDLDYVRRVLQRFREQPYRYTLRPPLLGTEPVDAFLFDTRAGFCEHYASAFAVLMRAAGVPARIVAGYQGGEINPLNGTVVVRQFDAHAWNEVWLRGQGWVRVDPTAAVSPERIEYGLEQAMAEEGSFLADSPLSPLRYRSVDWINRLRLQYDALSYRWQSWMVGFDSETQLDVLRDLLGTVSVRRFVAVMLTAFALVCSVIALSLFWQRRIPQDARTRVLRRLLRKLRYGGIEPQPGEPPGALLLRAAAQHSEQAEELLRLRRLLLALLYGRSADDRERAPRHERALRHAVKRLRLRAQSAGAPFRRPV